MRKFRRISVQVSETTRRQLDDLSAGSGVAKSKFVEAALWHHFQALRELLPAEMVIPARIVLDRRSGERVAKRLARRPSPKKGLIELMSRGHD